MADTHQLLVDELATLTDAYGAELGAVRTRQRDARKGVQARCAAIGHVLARDDKQPPPLFGGTAAAAPKRVCVICGAEE